MPATKMSVAEIAAEFAKMFSGEMPAPELADAMAPEITCFHCHYGEAAQLQAMGVETEEGVENPIIIARGDLYGPVLVENYQLMRKLLPSFRTEDVQVHVAESSIVITYKLAGSPPEGPAFRVPRCAVIMLEDGVVNRIDYYEDQASAQKMGAALIGSGQLTPEIMQEMAKATTTSVIRIESDPG